MFRRFFIIAILILTYLAGHSQATLPLNRTTWDAGAPLGWTDGNGGSPAYTSGFACSGSNGGRLDNNSEFYEVFFSSSPNMLTYTLKMTGAAASTLLVEESVNGVAYTTVNNHSPLPTSCTTYNFVLLTTSRYVRWTYTKVAQNVTVDDVTITSACTPVSEPAVNASAYTFTNIGCNGIQISWTSPAANDSSLVVMKAGSDVTTDPVDGTVYSASSTFGSGSDIGTSEFVVYDGSGTSATITGLAASTTYFINVFDYNGEAACIDYRTSDEVSSSDASVACDTCAHLTSALINSCDNGACTEGDNEMLFLNSGNYYVSTATADITINYGSSSPAPNTYGDSFTANATAISNMNADAGCGGVYIDATTVSNIPPNSSFLILNETVCANAFNWSTMCAAASGNIYVLFSDDATWSSAGQFSNSPPAAGRYFRTILGGCTLDYDYDNALPAGDGAIAFWNETAGSAVSYDTDGCSLPATVLPVALLYFKGHSIEKGSNLLEWSTTTEINNDYFTVEQSRDATDFNPIGTVSGAGNSNSQLFYQLIDDNPSNLPAGQAGGINYYRLKQTDFDGDYAYSEIIAINNNLSDINIYTANGSLHIESNQIDINGSLEIIDVTGRIVYSKIITQNEQISVSQFNAGIYIIRMGTQDNFIVKKIKL